MSVLDVVNRVLLTFPTYYTPPDLMPNMPTGEGRDLIVPIEVVGGGGGGYASPFRHMLVMTLVYLLILAPAGTRPSHYLHW